MGGRSGQVHSERSLRRSKNDEHPAIGHETPTARTWPVGQGLEKRLRGAESVGPVLEYQ